MTGILFLRHWLLSNSMGFCWYVELRWQCWANIDEEVIEFVGYIISIRYFTPIVFKLSLVDRHFIAVYDRFHDIPRLFHVTFVSSKQVLIILLFSHFHQILQFTLVHFIIIFIRCSFNLFILLIQFVFYTWWNFSGPQTTMVFYYCISFWP